MPRSRITNWPAPVVGVACIVALEVENKAVDGSSATVESHTCILGSPSATDQDQTMATGHFEPAAYNLGYTAVLDLGTDVGPGGSDTAQH